MWSQGSADSGDLLSYPSLPELDSFCGELQTGFPGTVALEKAGHSVQGRPIWLLTVTDQDTSDEDKQRVLMVGQEHGQERSASLALLELARWLVTPEAAEIRRKQSVGLMPVVNPDSWEDLRFNNVNDVNLYADYFLDGEPTQPESRAVADVLARMQPELFCSLHGTEFGWKYRMGESNGFSWTTSQFDRAHSRLFIEEITGLRSRQDFRRTAGKRGRANSALVAGKHPPFLLLRPAYNVLRACLSPLSYARQYDGGTPSPERVDSLYEDARTRQSAVED